MKASALFKQYIWLVGTISRAGRITLREINERWLRTEMSQGVSFSSAGNCSDAWKTADSSLSRSTASKRWR